MPSVAVVIAVFEPDPLLLEIQLRSIAAQTLAPCAVVAVIADRSSESLVRDLGAKFGLPLEIVTPREATSSYRSFEMGLKRALEVAPEDAVFALSDQDDIWDPEKLRKTVECLSSRQASLVHCDAELVDESGRRLHRSAHRYERRLRNASLRDLLIENTITGMTLVTTRNVVEAALPFPAQSALFFHHDLWIGLVASIYGDVRCVDEALVKYRQHADNVVGAKDLKRKLPKFGSQAWQRHWVGRYGVASYLAKSLYLRGSELIDRGERAPDRKRLAALGPYLKLRATGAALWADAFRLMAKGAFRHAMDSALLGCVQAGRVAWSVRKSLRDDLVGALADFDRRLYGLAPGVQPSPAPSEAPASVSSEWFSEDLEDRRTLRRFDTQFAMSDRARMVVFVPTLNPTEIFAGIATALDIGVGLAERGHEVMFVATDLPIASRDRTLEFLRQRGGRQNREWMQRIEIRCGETEGTLPFSSGDHFLATAWWTAYIAKDLLSCLPFRAKQFYYLIQDYEPGFYAWGEEYAGALASYGFDFVPIFNSATLADHFAETGVFGGVSRDMVFRPAIDLDRYASVRRVETEVPRLAVYGRPDVARNLFGTCVAGLERFLAREGIKPSEINIVSVGQPHQDVVFAGGHRMRSLGKIPWEEYPSFLGSVDIGLSLMLSPHPSHPPLEMAAAGARVVTNDFGAKSLGGLTPSIQSVAPTAEAVAEGLAVAWREGPPMAKDRRLKLETLGQPMSEVVDALSVDLGGRVVTLPKAS